MNDEYTELYNMLSLDREEVIKLKEDYQSDLSLLIGRIRNYHINNIDISGEYDLDNNFDKYKIDDIFLRYNINNDAIDYKIELLQSYLKDLLIEKKFNAFRKEQEERLSKNEFLEYTRNPSVRSDKVSYWYQQFLNK